MNNFDIVDQNFRLLCNDTKLINKSWVLFLQQCQAPVNREQWVTLCEAIGHNNAKVELARQLRLVADVIEHDNEPFVFSASMLPVGATSILDKTAFLPLFRMSVSLTGPWPG